MPLQKQNVVIPFAGGVQTKQNEFLVEPPNLLELENGVFRKQGEISKRFGFTSLGREIQGGGTIENGAQLSIFNEDLTLLTQTNLLSYSETQQRWFDRGAFASVVVTRESTVRNRESQTVPTTATLNNITVTAYEDSRNSGSLRYVVVDELSGTILIPDQELSATGTNPQVVSFGGSFISILYLEGAFMRSRTIDVQTLEELDNTDVFDIGATPILDAVTFDENNVFVIFNDTNDEVSVAFLERDITDGIAVVAGTTQLLNDGVGEYTATIGSVFTDTDRDVIYALTLDGSNNVRLQGMFSNIAALPPAATENVVVETPVANVLNLTGIAQSSDGAIRVFYELEAASTVNHQIRAASATYTIGSAPVVSAPATFGRSLGIASHAFEDNNTVYILGAHESSLQATYFALEFVSTSNGPIAAKILTSIAGGHTTKPNLPRFNVDGSGRQSTSLLEITRLTTEDGTIGDNTGVVQIRLDFSNPSFVANQLGENLIIAGGFVTAYDGAQVVEQGFHVFPEASTMVINAGGGALSAGDYSYRAIYEWSDARGQIHRSAPGVVFEAGTDSVITAALNDQVDVTIPTLRLTSKQDVRITLYRTTANGTIFYRVASVANDETLDTITITDGLADATAETQEILYTTGGVVENIAPPSASIVQRHQNRIFLAGLEEENEIRFSQESLQNEGLGFSDFFRVRVNPSGGPITALGTLDDKLIIFKEDSIFSLVGQGPNGTGANNDFQQPEQISSDVGCNNPASIVVMPQGLMFASDKGIKLLNRALEVEDIGAPVEAFERNTVTSGVLNPDDDEVRFTTRENGNLVYNYAFGLWSVFTNYEAESAVVWQDQYVHLDTDSEVHAEVIDSYNDNNRDIALRLRSPWLNFAGLQGYKRIYRLLFLGNRFSEHAFKVNIRYDYNDLIRETVFFNTKTNLNQETFPKEEAFFGVSNTGPFGNNITDTFQFEILPRIQKCEAIQLEVEDVPLDTQPGAGYNLTGITAVVGVKGGPFTLPNNQSVGSSQ
jgi:hypothetical protein